MPNDAFSAYGATQQAKASAPLRVLTPQQLLALPVRDYLLKGVMGQAEMSVWWGPPKTGKSFLMMHVAYALSQNRSVFSRRVKPARVAYIACEGRSGLRGRLEALTAKHGPSTGFLLIAQPVDLWAEGATTDALIAIIKRERINLLVVDTLNRVIGGGEENLSSDMGVVIANLDRIREETGAHVAVIHHGTKNGSGGPRGHGSLVGAADAIIEVSHEDGARRAVLTDAKDDASGQPMAFALQVVDLGLDEDGDERTTCLIEERSSEAKPRPMRLGKNATVALRALQDVVIAQGRALPSTDGFPTALMHGVLAEEWRAAVFAVLGGLAPSGRRSAYTRALTELLACSRIGSRDGWVWPCAQSDAR